MKAKYLHKTNSFPVNGLIVCHVAVMHIGGLNVMLAIRCVHLNINVISADITHVTQLAHGRYAFMMSLISFPFL